MKWPGRTVRALAERLSRAVRIAKGDDGWSVDETELRRTYRRGSREMGAATWGARARHPGGPMLDLCGFTPMGRFARAGILMVYDHVILTWDVEPSVGRAGQVGVADELDPAGPTSWYDEATGKLLEGPGRRPWGTPGPGPGPTT